MKEFKCLLFDCMETLIDMTEIPSLREYALWAFEGSGNEELWNDFDEFFTDYKIAVELLSERFLNWKEYEMSEIYKYVTRNKIPEDDMRLKKVITNFSRRYWEKYKSKCYIRDEVRSVLLDLSHQYKLGIVSNFKVNGGIEDLLKSLGISELLTIKIVSVNTGWRKPNPNIYSLAQEEAGLKANEIIFIGDDFKNDYVVPKKIGMKVILLDRNEKYLFVKDRVKDFYQLCEMLMDVD